MIYGKEVLAQSAVINEDQGLIIVLDIGLQDLQEVDRCFQERDLLREIDQEKDKTIVELKKSLALAEKALDLERKENDLSQRIIKVQEREIAAERRATEAMTAVADRAIKLAETSKPKLSGPILTAISIVIGAIIIGIAL